MKRSLPSLAWNRTLWRRIRCQLPTILQMPMKKWESVSVKGGWYSKCAFYTAYLVEEKMWKTLVTGQQTGLIKGVGGRCLRLCGLDSSWLSAWQLACRLDSTWSLEDDHWSVDWTPYGWLCEMTTLLWTGLHVAGCAKWPRPWAPRRGLDSS